MSRLQNLTFPSSPLTGSSSLVPAVSQMRANLRALEDNSEAETPTVLGYLIRMYSGGLEHRLATIGLPYYHSCHQ